MSSVKLPEVYFRKWRWWSDWVDVFAADYADCGYVVQMKRNRFGLLRFKAIPVSGRFTLNNFRAACLPRANHG